MDEAAKTLVTILGTAGGSAFVTLTIKAFIKWLSGAAHREQIRNTSLVKQRADAIRERDEAEAERDTADERRRQAEEHVAMLKNQIRELGHVPVERPDKEKTDG